MIRYRYKVYRIKDKETIAICNTSEQAYAKCLKLNVYEPKSYAWCSEQINLK